MTSSNIMPRRIVIAGGGVGAAEALLALTDLGEHAFEITLVAPNERFELRALTVAEPFAEGHRADVAALADLARETGATLRRATVESVDPDHRTVTCSDGEILPYDSLVLAPGARPRPAFPSVLTFGLGDPLALNGLLADLEQGYVDSVAFVVPAGVTWPLALYELALMISRQVYGMNRDVALAFVTPERSPLAVFGPEASAIVAELLAEMRITAHCGAPASVSRGHVEVPAAGLDLSVQRVVSLPVLDGPLLGGVPTDAGGFIPVDAYCRVSGLDAVYAVGDATNLLVKQGGLACQQADVVARHISHAAGGRLDAKPLHPVLRGRLLTGGADRFLRRDLEGAHGDASSEPLWMPESKVYGNYLSPWVARHQRRARPAQPVAPPPSSPGIDIEVPLHGEVLNRPSVLLGLEPLGAMHS